MQLLSLKLFFFFFIALGQSQGEARFPQSRIKVVLNERRHDKSKPTLQYYTLS